jgi:hypothetical protein
MTKPPTRADQVRMMGGGRGADVGGPKMTVVNQDDENIRPESWFVYVMPTQVGVELVGSGRYGYWDERPNVYRDDNCITVTGKEGEPIFVAPKDSVVTVLVAQGRHISAMPFPMPQPQEPGAA